MAEVTVFKTEEEKQNVLSTYINPFKKDKVVEIHYRIYQAPWKNNEVQYSARVEFHNGNTSGNHKITADDFPTLLILTEEFIKNL